MTGSMDGQGNLDWGNEGAGPVYSDYPDTVYVDAGSGRYGTVGTPPTRFTGPALVGPYYLCCGNFKQSNYSAVYDHCANNIKIANIGCCLTCLCDQLAALGVYNNDPVQGALPIDPYTLNIWLQRYSGGFNGQNVNSVRRASRGHLERKPESVHTAWR